MAQILDPLPKEEKNCLVCCYVNATSQIQIARITNIADWYFERVVFPGQRLVFEALPDALLEIHTGMMASAILSDTIPCERLRVDERDSPEATIEPELDPEPSIKSDKKLPWHLNSNKNHRFTEESLATASV